MGEFIKVRRSAKHEFIVIAVVFLLIPIHGLITGEVLRLQYFETRFISLSENPRDYWQVLIIYGIMVAGMLFYSKIGFPQLESYFQRSANERDEILKNRSIKQQFIIYLVTPIVIFILIAFVFVLMDTV